MHHSRAASPPSRRRRLVALALALALLAALAAPALLTASGGQPPDAGEPLAEATAGVGEGEGEVIAPAPEEADPTADAEPSIAEATAPPDRVDGNEAITGAHRQGGSEPAGDRRPLGEGRAGPGARAAGSSAVDIRDFAYSPRAITVRAGETVRWTNLDREPHDANAFDGSFQTRVLRRGQSDSVTFRSPGRFRYFCSIHPPAQFPAFTGTVRVLADGDPAAEGATAGEPSRAPGAGEATGMVDREEREGRSTDRPRPDSLLPATGLGLFSLLVLGFTLLFTGVLMRRFGRSARRASG
jgi:plastocyanin